MIRFGVAGNCDRFYEEGFKQSVQAPEWLSAQGLTAYEYSAGHGVSLSEATARAIGEAAGRAGVQVSIHAPYYINLASEDPEKDAKNEGYFLAAARAVRAFGGDRVVFHPGTPGKRRREDAMARATARYLEIRQALDAAGYADVHLCPETMGRPSQLGTLEEILALCREDARAIPTIDWAHLHAAGAGCLKSEADFERIVARMLESLGEARVRHFHSHFSRIAYTAKGEKMHMTFADEDYGPDFACLAPVLHRHALEPIIICESRGTQADDALCMKRIYESEGEKTNR